ncbi:MAG: ABC transporter substrate-binding protein, partial [Sulfurimonas sp.]|nr:ABC transporter substrate-binding protein [Sulfurimonas sp.]
MKLFFIVFFTLSVSLLANEKVVLQLNWLHQFQFAGYYVAKEKGFYEELGLDVEIRERDRTKNNIQQVINGEAEYGISDSVLLLYKAKKEPIIIVTPIFQHSPGVILTLKSSGIDSPYKLENKKLMFYKKDTDGFSILAIL